MKMNQEIVCGHCRKIIEKPVSYFNKQLKNGIKNFYCCKECQIAFMKAEKAKHIQEHTYTLKCDWCGKEFQQYFTSKYFSDHDKFFCSRSCSCAYYNKNLRSHHSEETKKKISDSLNKYFIEKGKTLDKENKYKEKKVCPICNKEFYVYKKFDSKHIYCSKECYLKDNTHKFRKQTKGGYRNNSGTGKHGWYKGYHCDSSWELAFVIYNLEHNIHFIRNTTGFEYEFEGKRANYFPDFIMDDGTYIEITGYKNKLKDVKTLALIALGKKVKIIDEESIYPYLDYAKEKYGTDFINLYESNPYNERKNKCVICGAPRKKICCSRQCSGKYHVLMKKFK